MNFRTENWSDLFPGIATDEASCKRILNAAYRLDLAPDTPVFFSGAQCSSYLLMLAGSVRVQMLGEGGREALLYRVLPGQSCVLTTCCMLSGDNYPAEGYTEGEVSALAIPKSVFDQTLEISTPFRQFVFANLGMRIAEMISRMEQITFLPVERRLARYLLEQSAPGSPLKATHQEIAVELCTVREVVSRQLKRLEALGLVTLGRSTVRVIDEAGMRKLLDPGL